MNGPGPDAADPGSPHNGGVNRGRLRIYLGAAPGVGKTYAMLGEAHRRLSRGTDVVVGFVETHGRAQTASMLTGLEVIPRRRLIHRGAGFEEMDVDAVLARRPQVALVDELAHTNIPGSRHTKRWQDIHDLLDAGIDVISTVNIQHLESLNDVVEAITGVKQRETVPDVVVRAADQLELVDMSPESLRRRLAHGNVYAPEKVDAALANYFRVGNLTALRELALLWVADRVEEGLERYRAQHGIDQTWAARQRIVVALTGGPEGDTMLRRGALIAGRSAGRALVAVHVVRGDGTVGARPDEIARLRQLTEDLSGSFHTVVGDDVATAVLEFARSVNGTQVVVGASRRGRFSTALRPSTADEIVRESGEIDVHVVSHERAARGAARSGGRALRVRGAWSWLLAPLLPAVLTAVLLPFRSGLSLSTVLLAYLLGVVASSLVGGLLPAIATALVAGLLANWFFTPPYGTLTIAQPENAFAILVFVVVGAAVATVVDRSAARAQEAARRRAEANVLASLSAGVLRRGDGVKALLDQARETFAMTGAALFEATGERTDDVRVVEVSGEMPPPSPDAADTVVDAGPGLVLALTGQPLPASDRRMLDAFAAQTAAVLERNRLAVRAADAGRLRESDAVRTALLAAVSHDLRTPLAGIKAAVATLRAADIALSPEDRSALLDSAAESADRLDALLSNLLDLSRLQTGSVRPVIEVVSLAEVLPRALRGVADGAVIDETDESLPLVVTDAGLLERSVANLVENAVRHSPPDVPVRLSAAVVPGGRLELRIVDRGPGVADRDKGRMFAAFQRLGDAPSGSGVGLGLAVARGLAEAVGATLEAEDTPGGGLTMVVSMPVPSSAGSVAAGRGLPRDDAVTRVLVVDDEPALARALAINLRARGFEVETAVTGRAALEGVARVHPDVVILDLGLPDIDGIEVLAGIRGWSPVPVVVLSARTTSDEKVEALDAGADDYVTKPFEMNELLARVRAAARRGAVSGAGAAPHVVDVGSFAVDLAAGVVTRDGAQVRLTPTEYHLLEVLVRNSGRLVPRQQLLREVWGPGYEKESHYLRVYLAQLRRKLEPDPSNPRHLITEPGLGYRLDP